MTIRQRSILAGAAVTGILSTSYLNFINTLCCLGVILGAIVTIQQYTSQTGTKLEAGDGAVLGALTGAGGAVLGAIFDAVLRPVSLDSNSISQEMMKEMMENMEGQQMSPEMMEQMQGGGSPLMMLVGLLFTMLIYAIFGAIGGAVGTTLFEGEDASA